MITYLSFQHQSVNMMSSVNKYKTSLEPAEHIDEIARKLLHQTVGARESKYGKQNSAFENQKHWNHRQPKLSNHGLLQVFAQQE